MKKKGIIAMLLACSFAFGTATMTACNIFGGSDETEQEQGETQTVAVTGVQLNKTTLSLKKGASEKLLATVNPSNATNKAVTWQSGDPAVATVDREGNVTAVAVGSTTITVKTADGNKTDSCTVTVTEEQQQPVVVNVEKVTLNKTSETLKVNETLTLTENVLPADANNKQVSWSSNKPAIASVVDGVVTAKSVGTAVITVTTADGNKSATCTVTVQAATPATVNVTGVELDVPSANLKVGGTTKLTQTVKPANATNKDVTWQSGNESVATVDDTGLVTAKAAGTATITVKTVDGNFTATCAVTVQAQASQPVVDAKITYSYAGNECAAFEWGDSNSANAKVEYKLKSVNAYTELTGNEKQYLIRQKDATTARVDLVGLKGGAVYDFKITSSSGEVMTVSDMTVSAYDRSGYAHFKKSDGVGAYNDDGTSKTDATVIYVNEQNKNSSFTVEGKSYTGIVGVLTNSSKFKKPLIVRIVGTVGAATWNKIDYNADGTWNQSNKMPKSEVKGINGKAITGAMSQAELIAGGYNTLDESVYTELLGLSSNLLDSSSEFDSCWNDCSISGAKNVTVEGIGEDARIFQWGMTFKNSNSIEIRNLTFEDYTEDACSFEGGSSNTSSTSADGFTYKNFWIHHNTFEEGVNYWDVCSEQDKHDGDGSTDIKRVAYVTFSYNIYHNTHKTGLVGSDNSVMTAAVTFHHNLYDGCKARLPLARQANMHMYNNYYKGTTGTDISLRGSAYALVENCYFEGGKDKNGKLYQGVNFDFPYDNKGNGQGWAKVIGCTFVDANGKTVDPKTNFGSDVPKSNLKLNASRADKLNTTNKFGANFDTDSSVFYYNGTKSNVSVMFTAANTKSYVPQLAGVQKRGVDVTLGGAGGGSGTGTETPGPNPGGETGEAQTIVVLDDFKAANGAETYTLPPSSSTAKYFDSTKFYLYTTDTNKPFTTTSTYVKLQAANKIKFVTTNQIPEGAKLVITMDSETNAATALKINGSSIDVVNNTVTFDLTGGTEYLVERAGLETRIASISIIIPA